MMKKDNRYSLTADQCNCALLDFYKNCAKEAGLMVIESTVNDRYEYDCRKVCITKAVQQQIRDWYYNNGYTVAEISAILIIYGPKACLEGDKLGFTVQDGFVKRKDE